MSLFAALMLTLSWCLCNVITAYDTSVPCTYACSHQIVFRAPRTLGDEVRGGFHSEQRIIPTHTTPLHANDPLRAICPFPGFFSILPQPRMSLSLTLAALRVAKPTAKAVIWPRMDQKSCLKAIVAAGFTPIVVENLIEVCAPFAELQLHVLCCVLSGQQVLPFLGFKARIGVFLQK